jgi:hypothetical protein
MHEEILRIGLQQSHRDRLTRNLVGLKSYCCESVHLQFGVVEVQEVKHRRRLPGVLLLLCYVVLESKLRLVSGWRVRLAVPMRLHRFLVGLELCQQLLLSGSLRELL